MSLWLSPTGAQSAAIGICDRCSHKRPLSSLVADGDKPGLRVCRDRCYDKPDPWRVYAPRATEDISLRYPRPETALT